MSSVAVIVPVLERPQHAGPLIESIRSSERGVALHPVFVCSPGDQAQIDACLLTGAQTIVASWPLIRGDYARKINLGFWTTKEPYVFTGADDLAFKPGWADEAVAVMEADVVGVVGTNDEGNPSVVSGKHSTHSLVCRNYAVVCGTIDTPGIVYHEGYHHLFCDNELVETAVNRGCFASAPKSVVAHLHPIWKKAGWDATYERGNSQQIEDKELYRQRRHLWRGQ